MVIYRYMYTHRVHVCVCDCFRVDTQSSHVGVYVFPCIRTGFIFAYIHMYAAFAFLVCKYGRVCPQSLGGCIWLRIYTQRLCVFVSIYVCTYTEEYVLCISAYMWTGFTWMCVHTMIVSACTHVKGMG